MREANRSDLLELLRMSRSFVDSIGYKIDRDVFVSTLEGLMDGDDGFLVITNGGMAAGIMYPSYLDGRKVAQELFWWVDPDKREAGTGKSLLNAFERWAIENGAQQILLTATHKLTPTKIGKIYKAKGYEPQEHVYVKDI